MLKYLSKILSSKFLFFLVTTAIILSLNLTPLVLDIHHAPTGRTFALIHNNAQDFFFYQSLMNEGANEAWLTSDPYTSESHQPSLIFSYFLCLGKISKLLGLSYAAIYHLARIILSILFLFTIYYLLFNIGIPYPRLAYLFFLFASPLMNKDTPFMNWWTGMDPIRRVAYLPHHMAGSLLLVITVILLLHYVNSKLPGLAARAGKTQNSKPNLKAKNDKTFLSLVILAALMAFIHTPSLLIILLILPPTVIIYLAFGDFRKLFLPSDKGGETASPYDVGSPRLSEAKKARKSPLAALSFPNFFGQTKKWEKIIGLLVYWFLGLLFIILMVSQTQNGFPWSQYIAWEKNLQFPLDKELIGAFGILFPLAVIGMVRSFLSKKFIYILVACWFIVPLLFIPFAKVLNISNVRLIQGVPYLPLAILAVSGINTVIEFIHCYSERFIKSLRLKNQSAKPNVKLKAFNFKLGFDFFTFRFSFNQITIDKLLLFGILVIFSIFTYPTLHWSLKDQIREYWPIFGNIYLDNRLFDAFSFINNNFPKKTVTLSTFYTGNYLPSFSHTVSFIGHFGYTYNIGEKEAKVRKFFENKMTNQEAKEFILGNKIDLIFQGPEEKPIYNGYLYPSLLKPIYDKEEAIIYVLK